MNYDNWKLASPDYSEEVSTCCGAGYEEFEENEEVEGCYICDECKDECEIIDEDEYNVNRHESYLEDLADEKRQGL
tara:strand:+ start:2579 stop:2806 length:228 start_codon:yes stop_codon:yes gene_type:complete